MLLLQLVLSWNCLPVKTHAQILSSSLSSTPRLLEGPSIYDVHTEGGGGQAQVGACGRGEGGQAPCGRPHRNLKLKSTDVILSSSHAKKLASFFTRISSLDGITSENFFGDIN